MPKLKVLDIRQVSSPYKSSNVNLGCPSHNEFCQLTGWPSGLFLPVCSTGAGCLSITSSPG